MDSINRRYKAQSDAYDKKRGPGIHKQFSNPEDVLTALGKSFPVEEQ